MQDVGNVISTLAYVEAAICGILYAKTLFAGKSSSNATIVQSKPQLTAATVSNYQ